MISYQDTINAMHVRTLNVSLQEYLFVLQVVLGEDIGVAYASVYDTAEFKRKVPSEDEEEYLLKSRKTGEVMLEQQNCVQLKEYIESEYQSEVQAAASQLKDFKFTGADVQKLLNNLLKDRSTDLSEASVRDIIALIKSMYESGALDSGDSFEKHFITIPRKYSTICPNCNREGYAVEGLDFRCEHCGHVCKWDETNQRYWPQLTKL